MPREDRSIFFTYEETYKALYSLCTQKEVKKPPAGKITTVAIDLKDSTRLFFQIDNVLDHTGQEVEYSRDFLAAALMLYCRSLGIPISKKATKSVELKSDNVVLRLKI